MVENRRLCCDIKINSRPVKKFKGKKVYVSTGDSDDMQSGELVDFYNRPSRANVEPDINDIIFAKMSNTSKTFLIDNELSKNIYSTGFFDISSTKIYPKFLYYLIQSYEFDCYKNAYSEGTTQISLSDKRLRLIKVKYENDYCKQIKITKILDTLISSIDGLISNLESQLISYDQLVQSYINEAFKSDKNRKINNVFFDEIPEDFKCEKIIHLTTNIKDGTHGSFQRVNDGEPLLSAKNVFNEGLFVSDKESLISKKDYNEILSSGFPKFGDVLFTCVGTIGRTTVYNEKKSFAFQRSVLFIRSPKFIDSYYLSYFFRSDYFKMQYKNFIKQSAQAGLYGEDFKECYVFYPDYQKQLTIVENLSKKVKQINQIVEAKKQKINELKKMKKSLIFEYLTGKKEVA